MQTSTKAPTSASRQGKTPQERVAAAFAWCEKRGISQVYKFFQGCDNSMDQYEARVRLVIRTSPHTVAERDLPWIESMELTMDAIDNRRTAA